MDDPIGPHRADDGPGARFILMATAWFGLLGGGAELAAFLLKCGYLDPRNLNVSRQYPWMFPLAGLAIVAGPGLVLAAIARLGPRRVSLPVAVFVLSGVAYLGFLFRWPIYTAVCLLLAAGLARWTARFAGHDPRRFRRLVARTLPVLAAAFVVAMIVRLESEVAAPRRAAMAPRGAKNVLLIVLDTVRAQSLGLYGYPRDNTPRLATFAKGGVRFDRAFSTAPWTAPSHAGMFTGRMLRELSIGWNRPLDRSAPTLAEALRDRGYATAGFVANTIYCSYETGLDRGFDHYEDYDVTPRAVMLCSAVVERTLNFLHNHPDLARRIGLPEASAGDRKDAARIGGDFLLWLDNRRDDRPYFAFLNLFDAHHPYFPPEPYRVPRTPAETRRLRTWWEADKTRFTPADVALGRDAYDRCIASIDDQLGRLFRELDRRGVLRETMVIVTADHGEHLGEQGIYGHGVSLYRPEIQVPLLLVAPGLVPEGATVAFPASLRDLPATVLGLLGLDAGGFPGRSLARLWSPDFDPGSEDDPARSELDAPPEDDPNHGKSPACRGPMTSLVGRGHHYIRNGDGREELYDLDRDPGEAHDLADDPASAPILRRFRGDPPG